MIPGEMEVEQGLPDEEPPAGSLAITNRGDRPVQIGSHYHLFEVNSALLLDRSAAYGTRLAIPAGTSVRIEPGETRTVATRPLAGDRRVHGFHAAVEGPLDRISR